MSKYWVVFGKSIKGKETAGGLAGEQQLGKFCSVQTAAVENPGGFCTSNPTCSLGVHSAPPQIHGNAPARLQRNWDLLELLPK